MRRSMRMLVKDTRSQDGKDDKDNDKGSKSRSQSMKEQAYNKEQRERPRPHELNDEINLIDLMKELPLSYESVDVVVGENWLLRDKADMVCHEKVFKMPWNFKVRVGSNGNLLWKASVLLGRKKSRVHGDDVAKTVFRMHNGHVEVYGYAFWVNQCTNGFHGVNELDDRGVTEGREDVREVFQQRGSEAKRKLSRCGRNQMDKVRTSIWRDVRTLAIEEAYTTKYSIHPRADTMLCGFKLTNRWLSMKKDIASCGSKYLAYLEVEVEYQGSSGLLLQPELPE
ncbi:hypothetical protein Tco_1201128 [Tanacetum coccineum]